jgi:Protein of unknown function (DUF2283)
MKASRKDLNKTRTRKPRAGSRKISIAYDREADVLSLIFGRSTKAEADEIGPGIYARYAWRTGRLAEVCILGFSQRFYKKPQEIRVPEHVETESTDEALRQDYLDYLEAKHR